MATPTVTVAVPAYNAERWIAQTLRSVVDQSSPPEEIVVVDDGSTDATAERAASVDSTIRVVSQSNQGAPAAYNRGFREASSEFVAMCPADDIWRETKLEWQGQSLRENADVDVAFGGAVLFGSRTGRFPHPPGEGRLEPEVLLPALYERCVIAAPTTVVRRNLHEQLGGFREDIAIEDYEFWLRALTNGASFFYDPRTLVELRQHETNLGSSNALMVWELNLQIHRWYEEALGDEAASSRIIARDLARIGRCHLGRGSLESAKRAFRESWELRPTARAALARALTGAPGAGRLLSWLRPAPSAAEGRTEQDGI